VTPRLLADENTSHHLVAACDQLRPGFLLIHISHWQNGACLSLKDPALLMTLRDHKMILVGFDRASMPMHAGTLTREGVGHSGVILFRRSISTIAYGRQARLLVDLMEEAKDWDWSDRIEYLPRGSR
jgi:hypothetical protein